MATRPYRPPYPIIQPCENFYDHATRQSSDLRPVCRHLKRLARRLTRAASRHRLVARPPAGRSRRHRHTQRHRRAPPAHDRHHRGAASARREPRNVRAARAQCAGARLFLHAARPDGLRRLGRQRRADVGARHRRAGPRRAAHDGHARAHRRPPAIHGPDGPPHLRRLPDDDGGARRGVARPGLGALRHGGHGRRGQPRHPPHAARRREHRRRPRRRLLRHLPGRGHQPRAPRPLQQCRHGVLRPYRRPPRWHGLRAVWRLRPPGLRFLQALAALGRRQRHPLQRIKPRRHRRALYRQRPARHARHGLGCPRKRI